MSMESYSRRAFVLNVAAHVCALAVAGVFLYAGGIKILGEPRQFVIDVNNYKILSRAYANLFALCLPYIEVGAALALIIPATRRAGGLLILGMLVMFVIAVAIAMSKGIDIGCGCFGKGSSKAGWRTIGLDVLLMAATAFAMFARSRRIDPANAFPVANG